MKVINFKGRLFFVIANFIIVSIVLIKLWYVYIHKIDVNKNKHAVIVETDYVSSRAVPYLLHAPGTVEAKNTVSITPQITAIIKHINFSQGDDVTQGQLLFELDSALFLENILQAKAILAKDQLTLLQNEADAKRLEELAKLEYVTKQQAEQAATIARAQAKVANADLAQLRQAEIQLGYTKIYSSIDGKTGNVVARIGDLAIANSAVPLVIVNQLNPVLVNFHLTQDQLKTLLHYQKQQPLQVKVSIDDKIKSIKHGKLVFIDNTINQQTGTFLLKADIDNYDHTVWPGMLVDIELTVTVENNAIVVPVNAIQIDQHGSFVYTVENNKATIKRIDVSRQIDNYAVISKGLLAAEEVVITIPPNFKEGSLIRRISKKRSDHKKVSKDSNS